MTSTKAAKVRWIAGVMFVTTTMALGGCGGKEKRMAEHMKKGRDYFAQGIYDKAQVEFKNVLQIDPKAAEPYYLFGRIEERQKNLQKAFGYYLKAVELDGNNSAARAKLGTFYVLGNNFPEARKQSEAILNAKPDDADGLILKASILAREGDAAGAVAVVEPVMRAHPAHVEARSLLAALRVNQGDRQAARVVLSEGVTAAPHSTDLRLALISLLLRDGQLDEAAKQYEGLIQQDPNTIDHRVGLARLYVERGNIDGAEAVLRAAIVADPEDDQRYVFLADFLAARRDVASAEKALREAIAQRPKAHALRFALAQIYRGKGPAEKAEALYREVIAQDVTGPDGVRARAELADHLLTRGKTGEAATLVAAVLSANPRDNRALVLRGKMALARGDAVNAVADFRTVLKDQPDSIEVVTDLARAHLANDEAALAKDTLAQTLGRYPKSLPLRVMLAEIKAATGDTSGAASDLVSVLEQAPRDITALVARANLESRRGDAAAAQRTLTQIRELRPQDPIAHHRLGAFHLSRKQYKEAETAFEAALALAPGAIEPLTGLTNVQMARGQPEVAIARLRQVLSVSPDNFLVWALFGHSLAAAKDVKGAEEAFRTAVTKNPAVAGSHIELARFLAARGQAAQAMAALREGLQAIPDNAALAAQMAELHQRGGQVDEAIKVYERMLTADANSDLAANNLASLLLDHKSDRPSHERAQQLAARFETSLNPAYLDTLGWAHYRLGAWDKAVEVLRRANARAPDSVLLSFHLGMALHGKGDVANARGHLKKAVDSKAAIPGIEAARQILTAG